MEKKLIENIGEKRYLHSLRVKETSINLGRTYNVDIHKIEMASILHDCAKFQDTTKLLKMASKFDIIVDSLMDSSIELIHGPLGAKIAEQEYGINDLDILNAIRYHTTGRENMTILEKIVYISDYIEPERDFKGVEEIRKIAFRDIDLGILLALEQTIKFLIEKNRFIHLDTIKARNHLRLLIRNT